MAAERNEKPKASALGANRLVRVLGWKSVPSAKTACYLPLPNSGRWHPGVDLGKWKREIFWHHKYLYSYIRFDGTSTHGCPLPRTSLNGNQADRVENPPNYPHQAISQRVIHASSLQVPSWIPCQNRSPCLPTPSCYLLDTPVLHHRPRPFQLATPIPNAQTDPNRTNPEALRVRQVTDSVFGATRPTIV